jgi:DNA-binding beta-propeller fold protein YncE
MWVANQGSGTVSKMKASDGTILGTFTVGGLPYDVGFDGEHIWVSGAPELFELRASDGGYLRHFSPNTNTSGIAFDGANVWVGGYNNSTVGKL